MFLIEVDNQLVFLYADPREDGFTGPVQKVTFQEADTMPPRAADGESEKLLLCVTSDQTAYRVLPKSFLNGYANMTPVDKPYEVASSWSSYQQQKS